MISHSLLAHRWSTVSLLHVESITGLLYLPVSLRYGYVQVLFDGF